MQIHVLASGSTGNCVFLKMGSAKILVDAGISARRIKNSLAEVNTAVEDIDGVFITHEHRDHISGLTTLMKKHKLPVYATPDTWQAMYCKDLLPKDLCNNILQDIDIKDVKIDAFQISHDAVDPVGFSFYHHEVKCTVATDLGFVTDTVKKAIAFSDYLVFESNHDIDMLQKGSYPWYLKKRIMSNRGHLSNNDAGWTLARMPKKDSLRVLLAHISKENNRPELAHETVSTILRGEGYTQKDIDVDITYPDRITSIV